MPGVNFESDNEDFDGQDLAETFDESMTVGGEGDVALGGESPLAVGEDMRTFEEMPDVYDVTSRLGDRDADEELAFDADEFDEDAIDDEGEDDNELDYGAVDAEHEDDLDGLGAEAGAGYDEDQFSARDIDGLDEVRDAGEVSGGEDDVSNFQSKGLDDERLTEMGYAERRGGEIRARPDGR